MKLALVIALGLFAAGPALARGHGAGSTAPMCSTCKHKPLCRLPELFSCRKPVAALDRRTIRRERVPFRP